MRVICMPSAAMSMHQQRRIRPSTSSAILLQSPRKKLRFDFVKHEGIKESQGIYRIASVVPSVPYGEYPSPATALRPQSRLNLRRIRAGYRRMYAFILTTKDHLDRALLPSRGKSDHRPPRISRRPDHVHHDGLHRRGESADA